MKKITHKNILTWIGGGSLTLAQKYYEQGAIINPRFQDGVLKAQCWGSMPQPYSISLKLTDDGVDSGYCTCPVGNQGNCKHSAALLLTWLHKPESFEHIEPLTTTLQQHDQQQLIQLISQMIARYPDLEDMVYLQATPKQPIDPEIIRRQINRAFASCDPYNYHAAREIASQLHPILNQADLYHQQKDWANAVTICQVVINEALLILDEIYENNSDLYTIFDEGSEKLQNYLEHIDQPQMRLEIFQTLTNIIIADIEHGGYGMSDACYEIVIERSNPTEKMQIGNWIQEKIDISSNEDFKRKSYGEFLLDLQSDYFSPEQALEICRSTGQDYNLIKQLLELHRFDEAIAELKDFSDYTLLNCADLFIDQGQEHLIKELILKRNQSKPSSQFVNWLNTQAIKNSHWDEAIEYATALFWMQKGVNAYQAIKNIAEKLGDWPQRQSSLLSQLKKEKDFDLLTRIYLLENDIEAALDMLQQMSLASPYVNNRLVIAVAKAAEKVKPRDSLALYQQQIPELIKQRGRGNYMQAAQYLQRIKYLLTEQLNEPQQWQQIISAIRNQKPRLPALLDELKKAGV